MKKSSLVLNLLSWTAFLYYFSSRDRFDEKLYQLLNYSMIILTASLTLKQTFESFESFGSFGSFRIYLFSFLLYCVFRSIKKESFLLHFLLRASISEFIYREKIFLLGQKYSVMSIILAHLLNLV